MYKSGGYGGDDRMSDLVCDRYPVLQVMSRFGIALGLGDKTIAEVCADNRVDTATFLAVVNLLMNFGIGEELAGEVSVRALTDYLHNSHAYFLDFRLPAIRRKLIEAVDCSQSDVSFAILRFFDEYVAEVQRHMAYEEDTVFPYVESLLAGEKNRAYSMEIFRRHHDQVDAKLRELKNIIIKYYPSGSTNELNGVLFDIFTCEQELASHNAVAAGIRGPADAEVRGAECPREGDHCLRGEGHDQQADCRCALHFSPHGDHPPAQHRFEAADPLGGGADDLRHREQAGRTLRDQGYHSGGVNRASSFEKRRLWQSRSE